MANCTMQQALTNIVNVFHHYSVRAQNPDTLTKGELKQLMTKELPNFIKNSKDLQCVPRIFTELDTDLDGQISFEEFIVFIVRLVMATHERMHENAPDKDPHHHSHGPGLEGSGHGHSHGGSGHGHSHGGGHGHSH